MDSYTFLKTLVVIICERDQIITLSFLLQVFIEANEDKGRPQTDYNGIQQLGVARTQFNTLYGRRDDTATAFLSPVSGRQNLEIKTKSFVTKVLIESKTATGVYFMNNGKKYLARAGREVILSAGALISPQLLMLSGIGPKKHLDDLGIPVVANLPVSLKKYSKYFLM